MDVRAAGPDGPDSASNRERQASGDQLGGADIAVRVLRNRWRVASLATGWRFPSDWPLPEVDEVCASLLRGADSDVTDSLSRLGRARAAAGAGLPETLSDLAALHAVLVDPDAEPERSQVDPDSTPPRLLTATVLAWVDEAMEPVRHADITDPLTGLHTTAYLRARLGEVYRKAHRAGQWVDARHALLVISVDSGAASGWSRMTSMVLVADVARSVFDGGETVAVLGSSTVAVLTEREDELASRAVLTRRLINERASADPGLRAVRQPLIRMVRLPASHERACELLTRLGR